MRFETGIGPDPEQLSTFIGDVFAASEGPDEGDTIRQFADELLRTPPQDLRVFTVWDNAELVGAVCFSRMVFEGDDRTAFILSPMAVATERHGQGIGQKLIRHGLDALQAEAVDIVVTYGDPNFYGRVGFEQVSVEAVPAPFPLSHPQGWLARALNDQPVGNMDGPSRCVSALSRPDLW